MIPLRNLDEIYAQIEQFDPIHYGKTRNFIAGGVSYLSPYLSRGMLSVRDVYDRLLQRGFKLYQIEAFVMELCWREHAQRIWQHHNPQHELRAAQFWTKDDTQIPQEILLANTGVEAIDEALLTLQTTGYLHNHLRMYLAALVCNHYGCHWRTAAKWLFSQLCDADAASNHLSWQWVCGANAPKVYYANQENINKYTGSTQLGSVLAVSYEQLPELKLDCTWTQPEYPFVPNSTQIIEIDPNLPTFLYTPYHLDPNWRKEQEGNRILFWNLDQWKDYPFTEKVYNWINELAKLNIPDLQIIVGTWTTLSQQINVEHTFSKEHPLTTTYGIQTDERAWLLPTYTAQPGSFFNFWKKVQKHLQHEA
jgi:deoxyribodipyrimidine photo-lyase